MMKPTLPGLHHVTAITADAQKNIDFYCVVLGLRLVKLTVNFDDPQSYHLYYGDELGRPGTIMTFFAWPGARRGRIGPPQLTATSFAVPQDSLSFWAERLRKQDIPVIASKRFDEPVLTFADPDGIPLEIVPSQDLVGATPISGPVPSNVAIRGFHGVTLSVEGYENTAKLLTDVMDFKADGSEGNRFRYRASGGGFASIVDMLCVPDSRVGNMGPGIVHHVAFRTPDDPQQANWRREIARLGFNVSPVMDRSYFHSIYFREPSGVLFEIATENPGFAIDEPAESLGTELRLPAQYEPHRRELEELLPKVQIPPWK